MEQSYDGSKACREPLVRHTQKKSGHQVNVPSIEWNNVTQPTPPTRAARIQNVMHVALQRSGENDYMCRLMFFTPNSVHIICKHVIIFHICCWCFDLRVSVFTWYLRPSQLWRIIERHTNNSSHNEKYESLVMAHVSLRWNRVVWKWRWMNWEDLERLISCQ